jgi:cellulose synthase/poly-beta-1,6-N-acetylglucosamine synthase-like glycosyltransferase
MYSARTLKTMRYLGEVQAKQKLKAKTTNKVIILIPVFKEELIAKDTVAYFEKIAAVLNTHVVFISTAREGRKNKNPTHKKILKLIRGSSSLKIIHFPHRAGAKAAQINHALDMFGPGNKTTYFAIFDADSRPDVNGIKYVMRCGLRPHVFQMPSRYDAGIRKGDHTKQAFALFQTRWTLCYEIPKWIAWSKDMKNRSRAMYLVGHGLFVDASIRFSENTIAEDLELGYRLSSRGTSIQIVPYFDRCTAASGLKSNVMQLSRWFYGELMFLGAYMQNIKACTGRVSYTISYLLRCMHILSWMFGVPAIVVALLLSISGGYEFEAVMLIIGILFYCFALHAITNRLLRVSNLSLLLTPARCAIIFLGPMLCILRIILDFLSIKQLTFNKTGR